MRVRLGNIADDHLRVYIYIYIYADKPDITGHRQTAKERERAPLHVRHASVHMDRRFKPVMAWSELHIKREHGSLLSAFWENGYAAELI